MEYGVTNPASSYYDVNDIQKQNRIESLLSEIKEQYILLETIDDNPLNNEKDEDEIIKSYKERIHDISLQLVEQEKKKTSTYHYNTNQLWTRYHANQRQIDDLTHQKKTLGKEIDYLINVSIKDLKIKLMDETNRWQQLQKEYHLKSKSSSFNSPGNDTLSPSSSLSDSDKIRAKAQAMISARLNRSRSNQQLRDETDRTDKYYQSVLDQIKNIDDQLKNYQNDINYYLQSSPTSLSTDHSTSIYNHHHDHDIIKQRQMFEKGLYVGEELAKFIDTLPSISSSSSAYQQQQSLYSTPAAKRRTSYRRSILDPLSPIRSEFDIPPPIPTTDRPDSPRSSADIKAQAHRRIEQRKKIVIAKNQQPSFNLLNDHSSLNNNNNDGSLSSSPLLSLYDKKEEKKEITEDEKLAQEKLRQAEIEARERLEKMREKRDLARQEAAAAEEKRKKAAKEAAKRAEEEMLEEKRRKEQEEMKRKELERKEQEELAEKQRQLKEILKKEQERKDAERLAKEKLEEETRQRKAKMAAQKAAMEKRRLRQEQEAREKEEELIRLEELKRKEEWEKSEMEKRRQEQLKEDQEKIKLLNHSPMSVSSRSPSPLPHQDLLSTSTTTTTITVTENTSTSPISISANDDNTQTAGTSGYGVDMDDEVDFATIYRVKALYAYQGIREDDLSFVEDEIVKAHPSKDKNSDWWYGTSLSTNAVGFFPRTYVEIIEKAFRVQALYDFKKTRIDDLEVNENDILVVQPFQDANGEWWYGTNEETGEAGYFPKTYVQQLETGAPSVPDITIEPTVLSPSRSTSSWINTMSTSSSTLLVAPSEEDSATKGISAPTTPVLKKNILDVNKQDINRRRRAASNASTLSTTVIGTPNLQLPQQSDHLLRPDSPSVSTWASIMDSIEAQSIPLEERQRQEAIFELIATERSYLRDLQMIVNLFYAESGKYLRQNEQEVVFSNIEDLLICNTTFLSDLETRQQDCANVIDCVGDVFLQHAESLKCYSDYCRNQSFASRFLQKKREEDQWFEVFLKTAQTRPECRSLDLAHFLLEPVQRITRYPLLLKQILKSTPKRHPDYGLVKSALTNASSILDNVNEETRRFENQQKMSELSRILDMEGFGRLDIRGREFIMDGVLYKSKSGRKLHGYLFNDIFLLVEPLKSLSSKGYLYTLYREPMNVGRVTIREQHQAGLIQSFGNNAPDDTSFQIVYGNIVIAVRTANVSMKRQWINQIQHYSAIKDLY